MIASKLIAGGGYGDCLPSGQYAVPISPTTLDTSEGKIATIYDPRWLSLSPDGHAWAAQCGNDAAGQVPGTNPPNYGGIEYLVTEKQWRDVTDAAGKRLVVGGTDPCIYDNNNQLHVHPVGPHMSTGGYRFVNELNQLIDGDATYGPCPDAPRLTQWTDISRNGHTLIVGQGDMGGAAVFFDGQYYSLTDPSHPDRLPIDAFVVGIKGRIAGDKLAFTVHQALVPSTTCLWMDTADVQALPVYPNVPPPKPDTFGPIGDPLPDGTSITMSPYVFAATDFHRDGDHGMAQVKRAEGYYLMKFGHGDAYELWADDAWGIHHLEDASAFDMNTTYHFTDTRWCRAEMKVGRVHGYTAPTHEVVEFHRDTKAEFNRWGYTREMWLWRAWAQFDCGPDLGVHPVVVMVYDPTGGSHTPPDVMDPKKMRGIELFYFAIGLGWIAWEYHHSGRVYQTGLAEFNDYTRLARTDFYFNGATPIAPKPTGCATTPTTEIPVPDFPMPSDVFATIKQFAGVFPLPQGGDEVVMHDWSRRAAEQVKFTHDAPGIEYGLKSTSPGSPTSNNLARRDAQGNHTWDYIAGSASPAPSLKPDGGEYFHIPNQTFIPVTAVNHLGDQKPRPGRAPWPAAVRHGVSGFDVAPRLQGGDASYYNLTAPLPLNCFVYTTIDHPATHRLGRTFTQGLVQTETLLKRLTADNRKAMFIMICGPHTANNSPKPTRAEILDMVRQQVALFVRYPKAVLALSLGNELYQGFEPPELLDPTLWAEVDQLVPLEFPFCVGQVSEAVVFGPGSFAAMHPDRGKPSAEALQILADAQARDGRTVVAREPKRIEAGGSGQASGDLNFVRDELANAKRMNLPYFLHLAAGRGCHVPAMDDVQHQALALIKAEAAVVTPPGPPVPPITPPGSGHPILDCNLSEGAGPNHFSHRGYELFVLNKPALVAEAHAWFIRGKGVPMPKEQESFFVDIRCNRECHVWITPRRAWTDALPGGAP